MAATRAEAIEIVRESLEQAGVEYNHSGNRFEISLPGEHKLSTPCRFEVGAHSLDINAFVCRKPDENFEGTFRWMLERNLKLFCVAFGLDAVGDIYLTGKLPLRVVSPQEVDRLLGSVLEYSDSSFNTLLALGFATSIRKEWEWRVSRGESTANLEAFVEPLGLEKPEG